MATRIPMTRPATGEARNAYRGISWTGLFFGPLVPLLRGHFIGALVWIIALAMTACLAHFVMIFIYNGWHQNWLIGKGYTTQGGAAGAGQTVTVINNMVPVKA